MTGPTVAAAGWRWTDRSGAPVQVLGGDKGKVYLLTAVRRLVIVDAATGVARASFALAVGTETTNWTPGSWQTTDSHVAVERLDDPDPASVHHYFTVETVVIAAT